MSVIDTQLDKNDDRKRRNIRTASPLKVQDVLASVPQSGDCVLTSRDYTLLEAWLIRSLENRQETESLLVALVRAKLAAARIVLTGDVEADRAREGSRVVYSLDGSAPITQLLAHWRPEAIAESILPITSLIGISLIGMRAPQRIPLVRRDGSLGGVWLQAVNPVRTRGNEGPDLSAENEPVEKEAGSREETENVVQFRPAAGHGWKSRGGGWPGGPDDPDPGPAAA